MSPECEIPGCPTAGTWTVSTPEGVHTLCEHHARIVLIAAEFAGSAEPDPPESP